MAFHESDEVLATRYLRARDQVAALVLYDRHLDAAVRFTRRILKNRADIDDTVQLSFGEAFYNLASWNPSGSFRAWLCGIIRYNCLDCLSDKKSEESHFRALKYIRRAYLPPEPHSDEACDYHSPHWFNPLVRNYILGYLYRIGPERIRYITDPPPGRLSEVIKSRQTCDRHRIAEPLRISADGRELSRRITNELLLASHCGKLPGGLIQ